MKFENLIVSVSSATVAAASLIFFSILTAQAGVDVMADFIAATAMAAMVQIALVPNAMLFVYSSGTDRRRKQNVFYAFLFEVSGMAIGAMLLLAVAPFFTHGTVVLLAFLGYALAGSTSSMGYVRAERRWGFYVFAYSFPSAFRLLLIVFETFSGMFEDELVHIVIWYFLLPEVVRYAFVVPRIVLPNITPVCWRSAKRAFRMIFHNWVYDIGSAVVEVGDRLFLSAILSAPLLVVYFFARRLGAAVTIILEPFYAIKFKSFSTRGARGYFRSEVHRVLFTGYLLATAISLMVLAGLSALAFGFPNSDRFVPAVLFDFSITFAVLILVDAAISANRWSRHLALLDARSINLLIWRLICLGVFLLVVRFWPIDTQPAGLATGFSCFAALELSFIIWRMRHIGVSPT